MKRVKVKFVDFYTSQYREYILDAISQVVDCEECDEPDFLFYGAGGKEHLRYDCVRTFWVTEELEPDFNICDYAVSYTDIHFYDRAVYLPMWAYPFLEHFTLGALEKNRHEEEFFANRPRFCNFIYSNGNGDPFRGNVFHALNAYKHVDSAGRYLNNMGSDQIAGDRFSANWEENKKAFLQQYRFTIAMSNAQKFGHLDEKIFDAWAAGTVPIYWGDPLISKTFNPKSFIDCTDCSTAQQVVERVRRYEEDPAAFAEMQHEPIVKDEQKLLDYIHERKEATKQFLQHIVLQDPEHARRRSNGSRMVMHEEAAQILAAAEKNVLYKAYRRLWRIRHGSRL